jgi:hypothetical protein
MAGGGMMSTGGKTTKKNPLAKYTIKQLHEMLRERGQTERFICNADREIIMDFIDDWAYGWVKDERGYEAYDSLISTHFSCNVFTDEELMEEIQSILDDDWCEEDFSDEHQRVWEVYTTYKLEEALTE